MEKYQSQTEIYQQHLLNHFNFLESPINDLEIICPTFKTSKTNNTEKYEFLKNKLNDLIKIKNNLEIENQYLTKRVEDVETVNKEITYELKIAKKDRDEVLTEKNTLENELSKIKVKNI
jgi:protease II